MTSANSELETEAYLGPAFPLSHDDEVVAKLRRAKNEARSRWRVTHVQLDTAARCEARGGDCSRTQEAQEAHQAALLDWERAEAEFIAARLGFAMQPRRTGRVTG
jgi:hypothetical protein